MRRTGAAAGAPALRLFGFASSSSSGALASAADGARRRASSSARRRDSASALQPGFFLGLAACRFLALALAALIFLGAAAWPLRRRAARSSCFARLGAFERAAARIHLATRQRRSAPCRTGSAEARAAVCRARRAGAARRLAPRAAGCGLGATTGLRPEPEQAPEQLRLQARSRSGGHDRLVLVAGHVRTCASSSRRRPPWCGHARSSGARCPARRPGASASRSSSV